VPNDFRRNAGKRASFRRRSKKKKKKPPHAELEMRTLLVQIKRKNARACRGKQKKNGERYPCFFARVTRRSLLTLQSLDERREATVQRITSSEPGEEKGRRGKEKSILHATLK